MQEFQKEKDEGAMLNGFDREGVEILNRWRRRGKTTEVAERTACRTLRRGRCIPSKLCYNRSLPSSGAIV